MFCCLAVFTKNDIIIPMCHNFMCFNINYVISTRIVKINPLHLLQKKALKLISNSNYIAHNEPICKNL